MLAERPCRVIIHSDGARENGDAPDPRHAGRRRGADRRLIGMPAPREVHRRSTQVLSVAMLVLGVAMIVRAVTAGGGVLAVGVVLGVLFVAAGLGRLWVARGHG